MKRSVILVFGLVILCCSASWAQDQGCQSVRLLLQANLDFIRLPPLTGWSGIVRGFLDNTEPLNGVLYYLPPTEDTIQHGQTGHEPSNRAVFDFGTMGIFVTVADGAVFQMSPRVSPHMVYPPDLGWGHYSATVKVAPDPQLVTGRFVNATGNLSISGTFLVNSPDPNDLGIWNAEITGKLCNVIPQK